MMDRGLSRAIEEGLAVREGGSPVVVGSRAVSGGCIHRAELIELGDGRRLFVKSNAQAPPGMFESEAAGLVALAGLGVIRVPGDAWVGQGGGARFLVMEAIDEGPTDRSFSRRFGTALAELHRAGRGTRFGLESDNYIGATAQVNTWDGDWVEFFRRYRIGYQLDLARRSGLSDPVLDLLGERLLERLEDWLDVPGEPPCLIHGDLWGGNFLVDASGQAVLVDPAVYYAHREAELAMTRLFGGFDSDFYAAYEEAWPVPPGAEERQRIYSLYHQLNHLNLFGSGYRSGCVEILEGLVGE
jgi:protein-ribulosamine 3-kinase